MCEAIIQRDDSPELISVFKQYPADEVHERLAVYRNNTYHSLIEAVKDLYPTLAKTVGEEFITAAARDFIQAYPPRSAAMVNFGQNFPEFISAIGERTKLPYIADIAMFDLLHHHSYHATDETHASADTFTQYGLEAIASAHIQPLASAKLLSSNFAIFDMWQLANENTHEEIEANTPQNVLVVRPDSEVNVYLISAGIYCFLKSLCEGQCVYEALEHASNHEDRFNPTQAISFLIQSGFTASIMGEQQ